MYTHSVLFCVATLKAVLQPETVSPAILKLLRGST